MNAKKVERDTTTDEASYDEMLDDSYEEIMIIGTYYTPSIALKRVDEVAYNCGFADFSSSLDDDFGEKWQCDECGEVFDSIEEAEQCCNYGGDDDTDNL